MSEARRQIEASLVNQLHYYRLTLAEEGVADINQYLATRLPHLIRLSEAQQKYVSEMTADDETQLDLPDMIDSMTTLIQVMRRTEQLDQSYLKIIEESLKQIKIVVGGC